MDIFDFTPKPGHEMATPDEMGFFSDALLVENNPRLKQAMLDLENDPKFSEESIRQRLEAREERRRQGIEDKTAASIGQTAETVPDVISFGFAKIVYEFIDALHVRFTGPNGRAIAKLCELYWEIIEQSPQMPYERFREVVFTIGEFLLNKKIEGGDKKAAKRLKKAQRSDEEEEEKAKKETEKKTADETKKADNKKADYKKAEAETKKKAAEKKDENVRRLYGETTLKLFEERQEARDRLPKNQDDVPQSENERLYEQYEKSMLSKVAEVHIFKLAKLGSVWTPRLDLKTRDTICTYLDRLCKVANLIDNFDPDMKAMINAVSLNSLNAASGKNKGEININALLDELKDRVLGNEEFLEKVSEVAMKQAK